MWPIDDRNKSWWWEWSIRYVIVFIMSLPDIGQGNTHVIKEIKNWFDHKQLNQGYCYQSDLEFKPRISFRQSNILLWNTFGKWFINIVKTQLNHNQVEVGLTKLWVCNPPTTGKLLDHYKTTQEADFRHATLF